jgi:ATP-dependent RNA helicase DeaD
MNALSSSSTEPTADPTFDSLKLSSEVRRALDEIGYTRPTPVQLATYEPAVSGRDVIVQARTGTGKTAAFAIPLADRLVTNKPGVQALVLAPTRELALQSSRELDRISVHRGLRTVAVYGGAPMGKQISDLEAGAQIVSGTPGRVLDHLRRGTLDASGIRALVLDEMDEMLSMGFARELNAILELIPDRSKRQTMCFSATVDEDIRRHAERYMNDPIVVSLSSDAVGAEAISHYAYHISGRDRAGDLVRVLEVENPESAIIFCNMRSETEHVATALKRAGFQADWLNGDLPQRDRELVMAATRESKLRYLVATDVAARGIDISHITHVINYSFPESTAVYVHRTGRTGRAGRTGCAISLVSPIELARLYYLRLQYKISPIERTLPSAGDIKTRSETDRIALLAEAFARPSTTVDTALAKRLLTHPEAEQMIAGLIGAFFGVQGEEVDERAATARRTKMPEPVAAPEADQDERDRGGRRVAARAREERPRERSRDDRPRERARDERPREVPRDAAPREDRVREDRVREDRVREDRPREDRPREASRDAAPRERARDEVRETRAERPRRERRPEPGAMQASSGEPVAHDAPISDDVSVQPSDDERADGEGGYDAPRENVGTLYLDFGRRDGARVGELARLVREVGELTRDEVGRIRVRDRHTFVEVPNDKLDQVVERLHGHVFHDKPLAAERAKR